MTIQMLSKLKCNSNFLKHIGGLCEVHSSRHSFSDRHINYKHAHHHMVAHLLTQNKTLHNERNKTES